MSADADSLPEQSPMPGSSGAFDGEQDARRRIAELESEVSFLRDELDRRETARQEIIDRYEAILGRRRAATRRERPDDDSLAVRVKRLLGLL